MPKIIGVRESLDRTIPFDFELQCGWRFQQEHQLGQHEDFLLCVVEGAPLAPLAREMLAQARVYVEIGNQRLWEMSLDLITPHDSVLEARMSRLEAILDGLAQLQVPEGVDHIQRLHDGLQKLGWKPYTVADHRRLAKPLYVNYKVACRFTVGVECSDSALFEAGVAYPWRCSVRGVLRRVAL